MLLNVSVWANYTHIATHLDESRHSSYRVALRDTTNFNSTFGGRNWRSGRGPRSVEANWLSRDQWGQQLHVQASHMECKVNH